MPPCSPARLSAAWLAAPVLVLATGCPLPDGDLGELNGTEATSGTSDSSGSSGQAQPLPPPNAVDILFVLDNSGSMADEQQAISAEVAAFLPVFANAGLDVRFAVTTTDNGNLWCSGAGVSDPEFGSFVKSSCRSRLDDFTFEGDGSIAETTCTDVCDLETLETAADSPPWFEGDDLTVANVACALPQGINGCGFEGPMQSMLNALRRSHGLDLPGGQGGPAGPEVGFVRDGAHLMIVIVTDEADCSFNPEHELDVFGPDGSRTFWSLPDEQQAPTSAVCWNAGVSCIGDPLGYDDCIAINKTQNGGAAAPEDAVLWPVSNYVDYLSELRQDKLAVGADVFVFALLGVPADYPQTGALSFAQGPNPTDPASFEARFGIGPGCGAEGGEAVPPVRLREFIEAPELSQVNQIYSVCSESYNLSLKEMALQVAAYTAP